MKRITRRIAVVTTVAAAAFLGLGGAAGAEGTDEDTSEPTTSENLSVALPELDTEPAENPLPKCVMLSSSVIGGEANFVIGAERTLANEPGECAGDLILSFSTYLLPGGKIRPFHEQVLIQHASGSGSGFGHGDHSMTASLAGACAWQSDLYKGATKDTAPHHGLFHINGKNKGWDFLENSNCLTALVAGAPGFEDPTCENPDGAAVNLPLPGSYPQSQIEYLVDGDVGPGASVTVTATLKETGSAGLELSGQTEWTHDFTDLSTICTLTIIPEIPEIPEIPGTPEVTVDPQPETEDVASLPAPGSPENLPMPEAPAEQVVADVPEVPEVQSFAPPAAEPARTLPSTGSSTAVMGLLAGLMMLLGLGLHRSVREH